MLLVAGRKTNLFAECLALTASSENPRLPASNLANSDPTTPAAANDGTNPWDFVLDGRLKEITDPHFDGAWTIAPAGWGKAGAGTLTRDTAVKDGGVASSRMDAAGGDVFQVRRFKAACGSVFDVYCSFRREADSFGAQLYLVCLDTGLYWVPGSGWIALQGELLDSVGITVNTWTTLGTTGIQVPNLTDTDVVELAFVFKHKRNNDAATAKAWIDNLRVYPHASLLSVHLPRNVQGAMLTLATSPDASTWTAAATIQGATARFEAWASFTARSAAWWRLRVELPELTIAVVNTVFPEPPAIGEAVLALARKVPGTWRKAEHVHDVPQARAGQGDRYRQAQAGGPLQRLTLERMGAAEGDWFMILNRLFLGSLGGVRDSVLVWDESAPSRVILGAIESDLSLAFDVTKANVPHRVKITGYAPAIWST